MSFVLAVHGWPQVAGSGAAPRRVAVRRHGSAAPAPRLRAPVSAPQSAAPAPAASPSVPAPPAQVPKIAGETVKSVTGAAGDAIRPASPTIADMVTKTGDQAGNVIEQVGSQVGGLVGGLTAGDTS